MALPDFFIAGVPKAGTTALHSALARHPALYLSPVKEPKYFLTDGPPPAEGGPGDTKTYREHVWQRNRYEALFDRAPEDALKGESTPFYLYNREAQRRIRSLIPGAKLIVVLRDPVERAHSNWAHLWSAGLDPCADFVEACDRESARIAAGWADFWRYTELGKYGEQLEHLYSQFPSEQVLIFRYRTLISDPVNTLDTACAFLGVSTGLLTELPRENVTAHPHPSARYRAVAAARRATATGSALLPGHLGTGLNDKLEHLLQQDAAPRRPLTWEQRKALIPRFESDVRLAESLTGWDCSDWLLPRGESGGLVGTRPSGQRQARNGRPREY
ncbi:MAG TPA: sulfotransferase [Streptosporangiaceae bacterium]|nr:sulfotransferase [Streptosporangiaceae bacterium]